MCELRIPLDDLQQVAARISGYHLASVFLQTQWQHQQCERKRHAIRVLFLIA
jgi:hypothetical protein